MLLSKTIWLNEHADANSSISDEALAKSVAIVLGSPVPLQISSVLNLWSARAEGTVRVQVR